MTPCEQSEALMKRIENINKGYDNLLGECIEQLERQVYVMQKSSRRSLLFHLFFLFAGYVIGFITGGK